MPLRVAEDASVLDLLSGGRLEVGFGPGGTASVFAAFGQASEERREIFGRNLAVVRAALRGEAVGSGENFLYPPADGLAERMWQATFSTYGAARAGRTGDGLLLSRTQPRPDGGEHMALADIQVPMVEAYLAALPPGRAPRIMASRSVFVADDRQEARRFSLLGLRRFAERLRAAGRPVAGETVEELIAGADAHVGTPDDVIASLLMDRTLAMVTDLVVQVHAMDPPHALVLRSIELMANKVAPALGWQRAGAAEPARLVVAG
jgi:putative FMN-dependent luciferase-like monooxygenase